MRDTISGFQCRLSERLLVWSGLSLAAGALLIASNRPFWKAFGIQAAVWGLVDAGIAWLGRRDAREKATLGTAQAQPAAQARRLRRLLWLNTGLDVLYGAAGLSLVFTLGRNDLTWRGHGWGIILQGGFLFFFDLYHALRIPPTSSIFLPQAFARPEHASFFWEAGKPAALLVHGFPGTPAEVRAVGEILHDDGWTVQGLLLPGFGAQIDALAEKCFDDWVAAVQDAIKYLQREHSPVLVVGYSMGSAITISAAATSPVDGLVLLAPFFWPDAWWQRLLIPVLRIVLPKHIRPLRRIDLRNPKVRQAVLNLLPDLNLDDPETRDALREASLPLSVFKTLRQAGLAASRDLQAIDRPALVVQGLQDQTIPARRTRAMIERFPVRPAYVEVDADHLLTNRDSPAWPQVSRAVLKFARSLDEAVK